MNSIERQKALYDCLVGRGNKYISQARLASEMNYKVGIDYYYPSPYAIPEDISYHDTIYRTRLTDDIREINSNPDFDKIIISNGNGVKIATEEDYDKMIKSLYKAVFAKLKRIRTIEKKAKRNGQITIDKKEIIAFLENEE